VASPCRFAPIRNQVFEIPNLTLENDNMLAKLALVSIVLIAVSLGAADARTKCVALSALIIILIIPLVCVLFTFFLLGNII
jgi:hypothetical protein